MEFVVKQAENIQSIMLYSQLAKKQNYNLYDAKFLSTTETISKILKNMLP